MSETQSIPHDLPISANRFVPETGVGGADIRQQWRRNRRQPNGPCWAVVLGLSRTTTIPASDRPNTGEQQ